MYNFAENYMLAISIYLVEWKNSISISTAYCTPIFSIYIKQFESTRTCIRGFRTTISMNREFDLISSDYLVTFSNHQPIFGESNKLIG